MGHTVRRDTIRVPKHLKEDKILFSPKGKKVQLIQTWNHLAWSEVQAEQNEENHDLEGAREGGVRGFVSIFITATLLLLHACLSAPNGRVEGRAAE